MWTAPVHAASVCLVALLIGAVITCLRRRAPPWPLATGVPARRAAIGGPTVRGGGSGAASLPHFSWASVTKEAARLWSEVHQNHPPLVAGV